MGNRSLIDPDEMLFKVKCSSEKTGCLRCRNLGLKCRFEISMVGKCSPVRRRRRQNPKSPELGGRESPKAQQYQHHRQPQHQQHHHGGNIALVSPERGATGSKSNHETYPLSVHRDAAAGASEWNMEQETFDTIASTSSNDVSLDDLSNDFAILHESVSADDLNVFFASCNTDDGKSASLFSLGDIGEVLTIAKAAKMAIASPTTESAVQHDLLRLIASAGNGHQFPSPALVQVLSPSPCTTTDLIGQHMQSGDDHSVKRIAGLQNYFGMICSLEEQSSRGPLSVDKVIHISMTYTDQIQTSMPQDCFQHTTAGLMLVLTIIDLIILLFEADISTPLHTSFHVDDFSSSFGGNSGRTGAGGATMNEGSGSRASSVSSNNNVPSGGSFGHPNLTKSQHPSDPEEGRQIWPQIIAGELRQLLRLIDAIMLYQEAQPPSAERIGAATCRKYLCSGLRQRICAIISLLGISEEGRNQGIF
ncbi:hypothetical protein BX600DRAFT_438360 [Xylariales sp. PMI_506]|nr:hypothetical protein BX600DRAFT_438360 [Xylariales sp. PMI_506]